MMLAHKRTNSALFWLVMAVSLAGHLTAVATWIALSNLDLSPQLELPDNVIKTKLVRLGKKRVENALPRKVGSKLQQKSKSLKPDANAKKKPADKKTGENKSAADALKSFADNQKPDLASLISNSVGDQSDEGDENGSKLGTEITGRMKADYNDKIRALIAAKYVLPNTLTDEEQIKLKTVLFIKIAANGAIIGSHLKAKSGKNAAFDNAVLSAAKKASPLPPPPIPLRDFYKRGVGFGFCPVRCN